MRTLLIGFLAAPILAGCVARSPLPASVRPQAALQARSDAGLRDGVINLRKLRFAKLDQNKDGAITRDEATDNALALPGVITGFKDYDADGDGEITLKEFLRDDVIAVWSREIRYKLTQLFQKMDTNGDMQLVGNEREKLTLFLSTHPQLKGGDANGDGKVVFTEFEDAYMVVLPIYQPPAPERDEIQLKN